MYRMMFKLVVSFLLLAATALGACAEQAVKLEYKFKEGDVSRYKVKEKFSCNKKVMAFDPNSDWDAVLVLKVSKVLENGDAEVTASYESGTMKMQGQTAKVKPGEVPPVTITIGKHGEVRNPEELANAEGSVGVTVKSPDNSEEVTVRTDVYQNVLRSLLQTLPDKELKAGETWKQDVASPSMTGTSQAQCTLQKLVVDYKSIKVVSIVSTIEDKSGATPVGVSGEVKEKATLLFAQEQGKVASVKNNGQILMRGMEVPKNEEGDMEKLDLTISYTTDIALIVDGGK